MRRCPGFAPSPIAYGRDVVTDAQMRRAVDLVLHDVRATFGSPVVSVAVTNEADAAELLAREDPTLLNTLTDARLGAGSGDVGAWVYVPGELGAVGIWNQESDDFPSLVVRVAESVQEVIVESGRFFGAAFPPCPAHQNHPLWAEAREGEAVWVCRTDRHVAVPVGEMAKPPTR